MKISVFGLGYVGITSAACLAELGHEVVGVDVNPDKVALVNAGESPIVEPGVGEILARHAGTRIRATSDESAALEAADAAFVAVGTPSNAQGALEDMHLLGVVG